MTFRWASGNSPAVIIGLIIIVLQSQQVLGGTEGNNNTIDVAKKDTFPSNSHPRDSKNELICKGCGGNGGGPTLCDEPVNVTCFSNQQCLRLELETGHPVYGCLNVTHEMCPLDVKNYSVLRSFHKSKKILKACTCDNTDKEIELRPCNYEACPCFLDYDGGNLCRTPGLLSIISITLIGLYIQQ